MVMDLLGVSLRCGGFSGFFSGLSFLELWGDLIE
jgi:hypothetical protein